VIRLLVVDDHQIVRAGVRLFLADALDITVAEAAGGEQALELIRTGSWDVVLLDLIMPGRSGLEVLFELKDRHPKVQVLVLSVHADEAYVVRAFKEGAAGYLTKDCTPAELLKAIRQVAGGGHYVMAELVDTLVATLQTDGERPPHERLSDREYEVLGLLARGRSPHEIAQRLRLAESTVGTYRARILKKMKLNNNAELTHYAIDHGLYDDV